ncbi:integrator complex subunit 1 isoform X1 [Helicoverpa zea]|uniref:integrator complex subunit 1 isoform X1 n=1 Tax=Helicoverpa zea TaxID=7113 RepID=UPI001F5784DA|nr:integrator complex subunit 1 isoform X1 [Helicoverpa zea]
MERGKMPSAGRGAKSKAPQHPQDIFALGSKSTVVVSRDPEKRNIHKPSSSGVERKRETSGFGSQPPSKRARIGSPAEAVGGTSLEVDPVDLVPNVLQALDTHNSDKLLGLLTGSIRLLKSQRSKPDPILCMSLLYLTKIRPNMFAHETVTQSLCTLLKREQGAAFKNKGNPLVYILACNMLYAGHRESNNWPDIFIKVYIEDALNERCWVECSWCKCFVENVVTAFSTKQPPSHLIPTDNTLGTMSPSGSGSPLMGSTEEDTDNMELDYSVFPRYSSSYEAVEALVLEAIKEQIQRRSAAPDAIGKGFLKLLSATCGFPEIRMISASRLEAWLHSGKLWRCAQELLAYVCCNCDACGPTAARDHEVLAQLARMRLKTKPLQAAYQACLREMVSDSPPLLRSVVTHTIYNELSNVRSPNNMAVLAALIQAQPQQVPAAMADTYQELVLRPEDYLRPLRALTREVVRAARADAQALLPLARALAQPPPHEPPQEVRERAFSSLADLFCCCCLVTASHSKHLAEYRQQVCVIQAAALGWLLDTAMPVYRPSRHDYQLALNKVMFVEPAETYSKVDNWPPESERAVTYRLCCEAPLPQNTLLRVIFIGLSKDIPVSPAEVFELVEQLVRRACALPAEENPLQVDKLEIADYIFQLCQFNPPDNITLPAGYTPPALGITSLYWRGWLLLTMLAAHNPSQFAERAAALYPTLRALIELCITKYVSSYTPSQFAERAAALYPTLRALIELCITKYVSSYTPSQFAERAAALYPTLRALIELCITNKPSIEWNTSSAAEAERAEAERAAILQLETHLAAASNAKLPVTEHSSRLLSQLTTLEPLGPARKPPQAIIETLQAMSSQMRLGKLLCRQPALLLELVERHGTRRAMPWLHQLLRHDQLELSVLPVQCLCEFLSAGGAGGEVGKAGELCAHLRRTVAESEEGARAVLHYYMQRLAHTHAPTRATASRGLKLVLQSSEDTSETDYNAEVSPEEWLDLLWDLPHWESVREEVVCRIRAACIVECVPRHVAAYIAFLAAYVSRTPAVDHTDLVLDLSQVLMERATVMGSVVGTGDRPDEPTEPQHAQHRALYSVTKILYEYLQKVRTSDAAAPPTPTEPAAGSSAWAFGERVLVQWPSGKTARIHLVLAHAYLKLLCLGPSIYDTNQEMYSWLMSVWVGNDAPQAFTLDTQEEALLLPDWLRLHMVRSARSPLLESGMRAMTAPKLALFIQTFGMPVTAMSSLLCALDACPAGAVVRLGVERAYMAQLLAVQRARGAVGGDAFAAALRLALPAYPPDDTLFVKEELPEEPADEWGSSVVRAPLQPELVAPLLSTVFTGANTFAGDVDSAFTELISLITESIASGATLSNTGYVGRTLSWLRSLASSAGGAAGLVRRPAHAAPLLRALLPLPGAATLQIADTLLMQCKLQAGPVLDVLRAMMQGGTAKRDRDVPVPPAATRQQLIAALETSSPSTLEALGNRIISSQDTRVIVDVITHILEKNQEGHYESKIKHEDGTSGPAHVFSRGGLGVGLLLDWMSELQREALGPSDQRQRQMQLMFRSGCAAWRPLLVTLLAHRASWRTLHYCLTTLLQPEGGWSPTAVLDFATTLTESPRVWQGRDKTTPKHHVPTDTLRLDHHQLGVLVRYVAEEARQVEAQDGPEAARRRVDGRLALLLRCAPHQHSLLAVAAAAEQHDPLLLLLLYMKVPKILPLLLQSGHRNRPPQLLACRASLRAAAASSTSATDRVSHALLTAIAAPHPHSKEHTHKLWRMESDVRSVWARVAGAGARALGLAAALLRGAQPAAARHHAHVLAALEVLPDAELFHADNTAELHSILECFLSLARAQAGGVLLHRVGALLRRYLACRPQLAGALLHAHKDTIANTPALSSLQAADVSAPASAAPPPLALQALQRRYDEPDNLHWLLQEIEAWGSRRGGAWGGSGCAGTLLRAAAPHAAAAHAPLRTTALALLAKLLPAVTDTNPGLQAVLECLDSHQPEVTQSLLDKLPEIVVGMQEHAAKVLMRVFDLGLKSRHPVEPCIAKCVTTINLHRGC